RELLADAGAFTPANQRAGAENYFLPSEVYVTEEENEAAYIRLDFGSDDYAYSFNGNIGLRYVKMTRDALGSVQYPDLLPDNPAPTALPATLTPQAVDSWVQQQAQTLVDNGEYASLDAAAQATRAGPASRWIGDPNNYLSADERGFGNNACTVQQATSSYSKVLPSLNPSV